MDHLESIYSNFYKKKEGIKQDILQPKIVKYGAANKDKFVYYIEEECKDAGFFAMYRRWLEYLYFSDICGYTPVINAGSDFLYKEKKAINNLTNPFEYYFMQPMDIGVREAKHSHNVILSRNIDREMVELVLTGKRNHYKFNSRYLCMMAHIVRKYIKFNNNTWDYINEGMYRLDFTKERMLGIHIRGTDFRGMYNNHPVYITENECFAEVDKLLEKDLYSKIFIATDDSRILQNFIHKYGNKICFYNDVVRNNQDISVAFKHSTREWNKYLLGLEVIRDMYALSMCTGLVAGVSQVAICAQIHKLARKENYEDKIIINKGVYRNSKCFVVADEDRKIN